MFLGPGQVGNQRQENNNFIDPRGKFTCLTSLIAVSMRTEKPASTNDFLYLSVLKWRQFRIFLCTIVAYPPRIGWFIGSVQR